MPAARTVALMFNFSLAYCRGVLRGIAQAAAENPTWQLVAIPPGPGVAGMLRDVGAQGVIAHIYDRRLVTGLRAARIPVVNVSGIVSGLAYPRIGLDDRRIGQVAALHFLDRGFRHLAFVGHATLAASYEREQGFCTEAATAGIRVSGHQVPAPVRFDANANHPVLGRSSLDWLRGLPAGTGVFAYCDILGIQVARLCQVAGISQPEGIALLGVDDDDLLCNLVYPKLSSIAIPAEMIGRHALTLVNRLIDEELPPLVPMLLPPLGVVVRGSSDHAAVADPLVAEVLRLIHSGDGPAGPIKRADNIALSRLIKAAGISRRTLERRFMATVGRGLWEEIRRVRITAAARLLSSSDLPIAEVARRAGFTDAKHLSLVVRSTYEQTPSAYRKMFRARPLRPQ